MRILTVRELNRKTASVLDAIERGATFELCRKGRSAGCITHRAKPRRKPDWKRQLSCSGTLPLTRRAKGEAIRSGIWSLIDCR